MALPLASGRNEASGNRAHQTRTLHHNGIPVPSRRRQEAPGVDSSAVWTRSAPARQSFQSGGRRSELFRSFRIIHLKLLIEYLAAPAGRTRGGNDRVSSLPFSILLISVFAECSEHE